ncbi:leishmanolysin-related zinc metalloendopeptidase [Streptomyces sp. 7N604]|uniref:leishmanolysin-related zinc metalloendopeptidase n=1 Tax=Streptomyces sp. 7N604 TaxID=3457415 RepID=UPI003FD14507
MGRQITRAVETYRAVADAGRAAELADTTSPFQIEVRFLGGLTSGQKSAFARAADRWARVIVGDLQTVIIRDLTGEVVVDDLLIDAEGVAIDGIGDTLGEAGPTHLRDESAATGALLPAKGIMRFDKADLANMEDEGTLLDVITHEMGHVLGIGTIWTDFGFLKDFPGRNPTFVGPGAMEEFGKLKRNGQPAPVPVANVGGAGSAGGHWRESVFDHELMSPNIGGAGNPLSRMTVASLADLGYQVDRDAAEDYALPDLFEVAVSGRSLEHVALVGNGVVLPTIPTRVPAERP